MPELPQPVPVPSSYSAFNATWSKRTVVDPELLKYTFAESEFRSDPSSIPESVTVSVW